MTTLYKSPEGEAKVLSLYDKAVAKNEYQRSYYLCLLVLLPVQ